MVQEKAQDKVDAVDNPRVKDSVQEVTVFVPIVVMKGSIKEVNRVMKRNVLNVEPR